jgi:outer membrane protein assembly factor BamD (BamD/ComL family)
MKPCVTISVFLLALIFIGCPSQEAVKPTTPPSFDINSPEGLYAEGQYHLKYKDYEYALRSFYTLVEDFEEDSLADDAQFMIAEILSSPKNPNNDLETALEEYENLVDNYPDSPYMKKAEKQIAKIEKKLEKEE